jgi:hypothetical protein
MRLKDLRQQTNHPLSVKPDLWAAAVVLGEARRRMNEETRYENRDRGSEINELVDLMGAFGELVLFKIARRCGASAEELDKMANHMFLPVTGREVLGADLLFHDPDVHKLVGIDAKAFDYRDGKHYFAINQKQHQRLSRDCDFYIPILSPRHARSVWVATLIPHTQVDEWKAWPLGKYGDPSHNLPLSVFHRRYVSPQCDIDALRADFHDSDQVQELASSRQIQAWLGKLVPAIKPYL